MQLDNPYNNKEIYLTEVADHAEMTRTPRDASDGANFLISCWENALDLSRELIGLSDNEYDIRISDLAAEFADSCVPIYTGELWSVWTDCGGYNFDGSYRDFVSSSEQGTMMNRIAQADCWEWAHNIMYGAQRWLRRSE